MTQTNNKKIVIVGSGYAGIEVFLQLDKKCYNNVDIVLISKTNYFYHSVAAPRGIVDEIFLNDIVIPLDRLFKRSNTRFLHAKLEQVDTESVKYKRIVDNQEAHELESLHFDYLILAVGSSYPGAFKGSEYSNTNQIETLKVDLEKYRNAQKILVVGGGPVGIEMAGEFATEYPNKQITLLSNTAGLIDSMDSASLSNKTLNILKGQNVNVILNDSADLRQIENFKYRKIKSRNNVDLEFDAYVVCYGVKPNTLDCLPSSWLDSNGFVKINKHFQVDGIHNVFAIGDCCNTGEPKLAYIAGYHAPICAQIVDQLIKNPTTHQLKEYSPSTKKLLVASVGRTNGVFLLGSFAFTGFVPTYLKSKYLFVPKYRGLLGY